jgi:hypothetical protein
MHRNDTVQLSIFTNLKVEERVIALLEPQAAGTRGWILVVIPV